MYHHQLPLPKEISSLVQPDIHADALHYLSARTKEYPRIKSSQLGTRVLCVCVCLCVWSFKPMHTHWLRRSVVCRHDGSALGHEPEALKFDRSPCAI